MGAAPLSILLAFADRIAWSQNLRTVSFIVPFPAGGGLDLLARVLARQIAQTTGLTIVVENRPGAASIVGAEYVSRAAPDGSTVLQVGNALIIHPFFKKLNYDPLTSFAPISLLAMSPQVIVVNPASPYRTLDDLIDAARAKPGHLTNASVGPATSQQIAWELLVTGQNQNELRAVQRQRPGSQHSTWWPHRCSYGQLLGSSGEHQGR